MRRRTAIVVAIVALVTLLGVAVPAYAADLTPIEQLGKDLFFDENLSLNSNQSCASCHTPEAGWVGADTEINNGGGVYEGSIPGEFGDRKPPSAAYGGDSPILHFDGELWVGGMFWDGRATGEYLGDPLADQAQGPFLNPKEQALPDAATLVGLVAASDYADDFEAIWGEDSLLNIAAAYDQIGLSIAAYEKSAEVNPFSSKYDAWRAGKAKLTSQERSGFQLFMGKAKCGNCHVPPLFTDFTYDNLGIPKNLQNPVYEWNPDGFNWTDPGLGGFLMHAGFPPEVWMPEMGKFKVPTLRNVDLRPDALTIKAYGHNAFFKSLKSIVHFYNTRDVLAWPEPEYGPTVNTTEMGNLRLSATQEKAIVAFMRTLSDGYMP